MAGYYMSVSTSYPLFPPHAAGQGRKNHHPHGPVPSFVEAECVPEGAGTFLTMQGLDKGSLHVED